MTDDASQPPVDLNALPMLRFLAPELRSFMVASFTPATYDFGDLIVEEGDPADAFFVVISGRARVFKSGFTGDELPLNMIGAGDTFGEIALLDDVVRSASVRASSAVDVMRLDRTVFDTLLNRYPEIRAGLELAARHRAINTFLREHTAFAALPAGAMRQLISELQAVTAVAGTEVVSEGDAADCMYFVESGRLRVQRRQADGAETVRSCAREISSASWRSSGARRAPPRWKPSPTATSCCSRKRPSNHCAANTPPSRHRSKTASRSTTTGRTRRVPLDFADELLPPIAKDLEAQVDDEPEGRRSARRQRWQRRFPLIHQIDEMDCGAACLAMVCRAFGHRISLARIRDIVSTGQEGTSLRGLVSGATALGFEARSIKSSLDRLPELELPAIIHWHGDHWVVLYACEGGAVRVADPAQGLWHDTLEAFGERWTGYAVTIGSVPDTIDAPRPTDRTSVLARFARSHARAFVVTGLLSSLIAVSTIALPIASRWMVDGALGTGAERLASAALLMLLALVVAAAGLLLHRRVTTELAVEIDSEIMEFFAHRLLSLPMRYFNARRAGDIERRLEGIDRLRDLLVRDGARAISALVHLVAAIAVIAVVSPTAGLVFVVALASEWLVARVAAARVRPSQALVDELAAHFDDRRLDAIHGIETIKSQGAETQFVAELIERFQDFRQRLLDSHGTLAGARTALEIVRLLAFVAVLCVSAMQLVGGSLSAGSLVAIVVALALADPHARFLADAWARLAADSLVLDRLADIVEQQPEDGTASDERVPVRTLAGDVEVRSLSFRHGEADSSAVLDTISFRVAAGDTVAIVGRSGAGKTTLMKCLAGLLEPGAGTILYDHIDLRAIDHRELRRHIGCVLQEGHLFADTIAGNIAIGDPHADIGRVREAATIACVDQFVSRLPWGYDTAIGRGGVALSASQRQRIAIARAMYRRPPLVLLDEATSLLEPEIERQVLERLWARLDQSTAFIATPRLSIMRGADVIVVLERGRLAEIGDHDDLMARQGLYYYLYSQRWATCPERALARAAHSAAPRPRQRSIGSMSQKRRVDPWNCQLSDFQVADASMKKCLELARVGSRTDIPVLILGETGVGKTLLARAIHNSSRRSRHQFVSFNSAALSDTLLDSQLFGHERGAFTGADRTVRGKFEVADEGTLFLDEIADMAPTGQAKILRAVEYGEYQRLGSETIRRCDVRLISATHWPIRKFIDADQFRKDLFYRLGGIVITIPPLRQRPGELKTLIAAEIQIASQEQGKTIRGLERAAANRSSTTAGRGTCVSSGACSSWPWQ